jgi:competence protein ComFC
MPMLNKPCLACGHPIQAARRDTIVRRLTQNIAQTSTFPVIFRLIDRLPLCLSCLEQMPLIEDAACSRCGRPFAGESINAAVCGDCALHTDDPLHTNRSLLAYNQWGKSLFSRFKYRGDERLAQLFVSLLTIAYYRHYRKKRFLLITFVPLHESRLRERGFNQAEMLAAGLGKAVALPVIPLLIRAKRTEKLSKQSGRLSRRQSMLGAFQTNGQLNLRDIGKNGLPPNILLIDDIFTTGSTVRSCAGAIRAIDLLEQAEISSLTIFR